MYNYLWTSQKWVLFLQGAWRTATCELWISVCKCVVVSELNFVRFWLYYSLPPPMKFRGVSAWGECLPWGVSAKGQGCLPRVSPRGCLPGGCLPGGIYWGRLSLSRHHPLPRESQRSGRYAPCWNALLFYFRLEVEVWSSVMEWRINMDLMWIMLITRIEETPLIPSSHGYIHQIIQASQQPFILLKLLKLKFQIPVNKGITNVVL